MQIPKQKIMDMLRSNDEPGDSSKADQADQELPQEVDTDNPEHQSMLQKFGIEPKQLMSKVSGSLGL